MYINKNKINPELHLPTKIPFHVKESTVNSPAPPPPRSWHGWQAFIGRSLVLKEQSPTEKGETTEWWGKLVGWKMIEFWFSEKYVCVFCYSGGCGGCCYIYIYIFFVVVSIHFPTERDFNLNCHKQQHGVQFRFYHSVGASLWFFMLQGRILKFHFCHQLGTVQWGCIPVCSILHFYDYCRTMESLPDLFGKLWPDCRPLSLVMWFDKWNQLLKKSPYFGLVTFFSYCLPRSWVGWI